MRHIRPEEDSDLKGLILDRIRERGSIPFVEFMELCLYHPTHGYYQRKRGRIGKRGDYYTSPSVHPVFGRLIGRQLAEMDGFLGGGTFWVIEAGAGSGNLARDILDHLAAESPAVFERLHYGIVERSVASIEEQKGRLSPYCGKVDWLDLEQAGEGSLQGCFLSNEFFDAFPVHRIGLKEGILREAYVAEVDGSFREIWGDVSSEEVLQYVNDIGIQLEEGQEGEVNLGAPRWYDQVSRVLNRGFLLTIDYGYLAQDLYAPERGSGTLLCYYRHTCSDDLYAHAGLQDMTAHVNFTGLIRKGESLGFHLTGFVPQYQFLLSLGFLDEIEKERRRQTHSTESLMECLTMKRLILPDGGMGDTFKVLIQHRGIDHVRLTGLEPL